MSNSIVEALPLEKLFLNEGPHWDAKKQELLYVNILGKSIHRYVPATGEEYKLIIQEKGEGHDSVPFIVPVESQPNKYVIGLGRSIRCIEWDGVSKAINSMKTLAIAEDNNLNGRFNDGKCDSNGRLWAGTMGYEPVPLQLEEKKGLLYSLDKNGNLESHLSDIDIANGLAWSPDNTIFYYIDSLAYRVDAFDYDSNAGTISNRRPAFDFKANNMDGVPDGMCIDAIGNLWVASFAGGKVLHVDPNIGKLIDYVQLPTLSITSCCFGGPNLDTLYVTSALHGRSKEELATDFLAGSMFKVTNCGAKGVSGGVAYSGTV